MTDNGTFIAGGRGYGKTHHLIEAMIAPGNEKLVYIAATEQRALFALEMAIDMIQERDGKRITKIRMEALKYRFMGAGRYALNARGYRSRKVVVDNFMDVLATLMNADIVAITEDITPMDLVTLEPRNLIAPEGASE